jgi:KDO2-lipid IV(A) lauroyltransferase
MRLRLSTKRKSAAVGGHIMLLLFWLIRALNPERTSNIVGKVMERVGPRLRGHRIARANLKAAFPEKAASEIEKILKAMWRNLGQVAGEYAFLDRLWDFDLSNAKPGRIVIEQDTLDRIARMRALNKPVLYFAAHLANWELPPVMAKALGLQCVTVYRPPEFGAIADQIVNVRARVMGKLVPAGPGAAIKLKRALDQGLSINMLVDQHFVGGVDALFFGRFCKVNPTFGRLARLLDCTICGSRIVRLADNRYRCELTEPLLLPRDTAGKIDIVGTMQMMTWVIEGWVREHPDQWLWMHRRWR